MTSIFYQLFPHDRKHLIGTLSGASIIEGFRSQEEFREMIIGCLTGENPRLSSEIVGIGIVLSVIAGIEEMFSIGKNTDPNFIAHASSLATKYLFAHYNRQSSLSKDDRILCQWICNLTDKGYANIIEKNPENLIEWNKRISEAQISVGGNFEANVIRTTSFNASLAKKGGLKSAMGNLFESLLLYSSLIACGLKFVQKGASSQRPSLPYFTLDVTDDTSTKGRQTDALIHTGVEAMPKICIDIGFIGLGNPEIIADKTQRFSNIVGGGKASLVGTIIIVSSIPEKKGRLVEKQAEMTGAIVIPMSGKNWINQLSAELRKLGVITIPFSENFLETRRILSDTLPSSVDILTNIPRNLELPTHWD